MREKAKWVTAMNGKELPTGENSQIRASLIETEDKKTVGVVHLHKWAKYLTASDKQQGLTKDTVPFRPAGATKEGGSNGISFPASVIPAMIADLKAMYDFAVSNGMVEFDPTTIEPKVKAKPVKTRKTVV